MWHAVSTLLLLNVALTCWFARTVHSVIMMRRSVSTNSSTSTSTEPINIDVTNHNKTVVSDGVITNGYVFGDGRNGGAALRAFYVLMGLILIIIVYFAVRSVRLRRKRSKSHKYGVIARNGDLEMTPLDQDDEDETTVFEATNHLRN